VQDTLPMNTEAATKRARPRLGLGAVLLLFLGMMLLAWLISSAFGPRSLLATASSGPSVVRQAAWGVAIGLSIAIPAWILILNVAAFAAFRDQMLELADRMDLRGFNPLWMGLCAGVGEEALFRGALQPLIGIWWTSLVFTLAHFRTGSFQSMNRTKWGYAGFVLLASLLMGYVFIEVGLIAAAVAHSVVDVIGIAIIRRALRGAATGGDS
jgi:membrane protease YdiL (CAAX protease family)